MTHTKSGSITPFITNHSRRRGRSREEEEDKGGSQPGFGKLLRI